MAFKARRCLVRGSGVVAASDVKARLADDVVLGETTPS